MASLKGHIYGFLMVLEADFAAAAAAALGFVRNNLKHDLSTISSKLIPCPPHSDLTLVLISPSPPLDPGLIPHLSYLTPLLGLLSQMNQNSKPTSQFPQQPSTQGISSPAKTDISIPFSPATTNYCMYEQGFPTGPRSHSYRCWLVRHIPYMPRDARTFLCSHI